MKTEYIHENRIYSLKQSIYMKTEYIIHENRVYT